MSEPQTVRFNVGGQRYEVSRALIVGIPCAKNSMLASLVSERWSSSSDSGGDGIFIDRNGVHFAHVLDYLRYGSVNLPATVSKADFLRDLEYYGIAVEMEAIQDCGWEALISKAVEREISRVRKRGPSDYVAQVCGKTLRTEKELKTRFSGSIDESAWDMFEKVFGDFDEEHFNMSLSKHDLVFVKSERSWGSVYVHVARIEREPGFYGTSMMNPLYEVDSKLSQK